MNKRGIVRTVSFLCAVCMIIFQSLIAVSATPSTQNDEEELNIVSVTGKYSDYISANSDKNFSNEKIILNSENVASKDVEDINGTVCNIINEKNTEVCYEFDVSRSGMYNIAITYYDLLDSSLSLKIGFYIDGKSPYTELENISFSKIYSNESNTVKKDEFGNEIRPTQKAIQRFNTEWAESETGRYSNPYAVYLENGTHTLTIKKVLGSMLISEIKLMTYEAPISYEDYFKKYSESSPSGNDSYLMEAENTFEVSDSTLGATSNNTNAGMSPASGTLRVINEFGGDYWTVNGQWGSWKVPDGIKEGLYRLSFRAKQTGSVGVSSYRKLYINGEIPFSEASGIEFEYNSKWQITTFGGQNPYYVYLKPGDIITLEATTGEMASVMNSIDNALEELNEIYQSIIVVTGTTPDSNRDYNLKSTVPGLLERISSVSSEIDDISEKISAIMGENNTKVYFLKRFSNTLKGYVSNYRIIVDELSNFKELIDSFAAQTYDFNSTPLELDWILLSQSSSEIPKANAGILKSFLFEAKRFLYTFSSEYKAETAATDKEITVWCSLGRDQAQAVKTIIENDFVSKTGINVNFKMTSTSLSEAVLSGKEPDVSLSVTQDVPINMALRGQALDITPYLENNSDDLLSDINESAWIPFQYDGGTYAIPLTQDFYMMFYRSDILAKMDIALPQTWDELYQVIRELKKSNFSVGIKEADSASAGVSTSIPVFDMFLYQNGGRYFNDDFTVTDFESDVAKSAFKSWVALYRDYDLSTDFNLLTRFRSGEMPIILTNYSFYQTVAATAQEITGRWGMTLIPGTPAEDGTVNRTETCTVTGVMILKGSERRNNADESFEFAKWWASSSIQSQYSNAMESIQGIAGRQLSANMVAFKSLNWTDTEKDILNKQRDWVTAVNQIPGTYIINRSLSNALRTSYASTSVDPLRQFNIQNSLINTELKRKRSEFVESN